MHYSWGEIFLYLFENHLRDIAEMACYCASIAALLHRTFLEVRASSDREMCLHKLHVIPLAGLCGIVVVS